MESEPKWAEPMTGAGGDGSPGGAWLKATQEGKREADFSSQGANREVPVVLGELGRYRNKDGAR